MKRKKIVVPLDPSLKRKLDAKRKDGYTIVGFVTKVLREALR